MDIDSTHSFVHREIEIERDHLSFQHIPFKFSFMNSINVQIDLLFTHFQYLFLKNRCQFSDAINVSVYVRLLVR